MCVVFEIWQIINTLKTFVTKSGLISEGILTLVPLPTKSAKLFHWAEDLNKLLTVMGEKFKFSAQGSDLAPFVANGTKYKIPSEIKPLW